MAMSDHEAGLKCFTRLLVIDIRGDRVTDRSIAAQAFLVHLCQHRHADVHIVVDPDLTLALV
jgi:hypothetical protein